MIGMTSLVAGFVLAIATSALADPAELEAARQAWQAAFNAGECKVAADTLYTADARLLPSGAPMVQGRDAIAKFWQGAFDAGVHGIELKTVATEEHGDTAILTGAYSVMVPGKDGNAMKITGKEIIIYEKAADGHWLMSQDIWNGDN